jgi:hypothetical protein
MFSVEQEKNIGFFVLSKSEQYSSGMSSFQLSGLLSPDSESNVQAAEKSKATTSSLSLPPLRSIDPLQRPVIRPSQGSGYSSQLPPAAGLPPITQYHPHLPCIPQYYDVPRQNSSGTRVESATSAVRLSSLPQPTLVPIAQSESHRLISGERHKKEIKRRTKTGCLTCRKRRIKVSRLCIEDQAWKRIVQRIVHVARMQNFQLT